MKDEEFDGLSRDMALGSRRWLTRGALGAALAGLSALHDPERAGARKKGGKGKGKKGGKGKGSKGKGKKKKGCRGREVAECLPGEDTQWCVPAEGNPKVCCPEHRIYAVCPNEAITPSGCTAPEEQAPDVCCPESRVCGSRCCEGPFLCDDAATSTCTGAPPVYARIRRRR